MEDIFSYSKINTYVQCPLAYKLIYIDKVDKVDNFFAQWGTLCHEVLELYAKGELERGEMLDYYEDHYHQIDMDAPFFINQNNYYLSGATYFQFFRGIRGEILGVEREILVDIDGIKLRGFIDLELDYPEGMAILDHKSSNRFKNSERYEKIKQLYLYSLGMKEAHGKYPKELIYNFFRKRVVDKIPFSIKDKNNAVKWVKETVEEIDKETNWEAKPDGFYCKHLCSARESCPVKKELYD